MPGRNDAAPPWAPPTWSPEPSMGVLPVITNPEDYPDRAPRSNAATAASAAGVRALSAQVVAFYFRAPAKAFFRTRVDYLAYARTVHHEQLRSMLDAVARDQPASKTTLLLRHAWIWMRSTTPGVLTSAVKQQGWGVIPHQILPPLVANVGVGAVLYTSYLHILGRLHEESAKATARVYPPPSPAHTFAAGLLAGGLQSVLAAPLDALQARYDHHDMMPSDGGNRPRSMWSFGAEKLREIGLRGIFAGWGLSFAKDSLGSAVFFSTFEYVKAQGYYRFVTWYYGGLGQDTVDLMAVKRPTQQDEDGQVAVIRPHYALEPMFLLVAGSGASFSQQLLLHPLTHLQVKHWDHLEDLDDKAARYRASRAASRDRDRDRDRPPRRWRMLRAYYHAYRETWAGCTAEAAAEGQRLASWLYRGFWWNTVRQVPSTSAGLIIFELIRRKYGYGADQVRITKDGYDILLS
ncbi:mitochondrial carrier protein [Metarhizium album ARSEF 1941]|uniref:Mitochondrial carrier protein n=1 Tax=Metarhizium album (strain ARSEF 1941) TaxID=1081103 RepID=A0A0B2WTB7_METAS|nr:mitochondrial carrier protein [Metarhizium album ARSEF 1941]KHN97243.1 mitochondrial carrier protein [Metarhizium album ARSEF 1941]